MKRADTPEDADQAKHIADLAMHCAMCCLKGRDRVTVSLSAGPRPAGFPRGELLSIGSNGARNYSVDPLKVLAWMQKTAKAAA